MPGETRPSGELEAITRRAITAFFSGDGDTIANLLSASDPLVVCGSAENELWEGDVLRDSYAAHVNEFPASQIVSQRVRAFETGNTGWGHWTGAIELSTNGKTIGGRITLVFILERGIWRIQHIHNSVAMSNLEMLGYEHTALNDLLAAAEDEAPRIGLTGIASVMFTDIADSSAIAQAIGDSAWSATVNRHLELVGDAVAKADGQLVKSLGDGTMSSFASARAAMSAARDIQRRLDALPDEPRLRVRIGIHTGDVVQAGDDFFGTVVNKAARIAMLARPGKIRVSDATRIMIGGAEEFAFADPATVPLKGLDGEHLIYRLEWRA